MPKDISASSFEDIQKESKQPLTMADMTEALKLVQTLEPAGVGARNLQECLLIQLDAVEEDEELSDGHDFALERSLITEHLNDLEMNRYPQISKKLGRPIDEIQRGRQATGRLESLPRQTDRRQRRPAHHARRHHLLRRRNRQIRNRNDQRPGAEPLHQRHVPQDAQGPHAGQKNPANSCPTTSATPAG